MDDKHDVKPGATEASAPPTRAAHAGSGGAGAGQATRMLAKTKLAAVQRLMRGESLEALSRELNVPARRRLPDWRDRALIAAGSAVKERERDARDEEIAWLKAESGGITMSSELLFARIGRLEAGHPLAGRRPKK